MISNIITLATVALVIAVSTVEVYEAVDGGYNVFIGDYGYHLAERETQ